MDLNKLVQHLATSYLFNGVEVILTGRTAVREIQRKNKAPLQDTLYEITPVSERDGAWRQWVRIKELYVIQKQPGE